MKSLNLAVLKKFSQTVMDYFLNKVSLKADIVYRLNMKKLFIALTVLFLVTYILPLGMRPLVVPDETRYAEIPREMISSGNWITPALDGMPYYEKPVMGYWLNALSMLFFGENEFASRLPTALSAGLSALIVFFFAKRYMRDSLKAASASAVYLTFMMVFLTGIFSVLDSMFSCFVTASLVFFFFAYETDENKKRQVLFLLLAGVFSGLAFLTKGFLAFAIAGAIIAPFLLWEKGWKKLFTMSWLPAIGVVLVAAPWSLAVHFKDPDFWRYFFLIEHVQRLLGASEYQHSAPCVYYVPFLLGGALPWIFLAPAAFSKFRLDSLKDRTVRYCLCWIIVPFLCFSAASGKLATYILPCFPPLAVLIASGLWTYFEKTDLRRTRLFNYPLLALAALFAVAALLFAVNQLTGFPQTLYSSSESWKWPFVAIAAASWGFFTYIAAKSVRPANKIFYFAIAPLTFMLVSHFVFPDRAAEGKAPGAFLMAHKNKVTPETVIVTYKNVTHAVCWYYKRSDCLLFMEPGEFEYPLTRPQGAGRFIKKAQELDEFIKKTTKERPLLLLIRTKIYEKDCGGKLPVPDFVETKGEFTIAHYYVRR